MCARPRVHALAAVGRAQMLTLLLAAWPAAAGAAFERPALSPEAEAVGGVLALAADPVFGNPASAACSAPPTRFACSAVARPFGLPELSEAQAGAARTGLAGAAIGVRRFGAADYAEHELRVSLAHVVGDAVSFGIVARGLSAGGDGIAARRTVAVDAGVIAHADADTRAAVFLGTLLGEVPGDPEGRARRTAFGLARRVGGGVEVLVELARREGGPLGTVAGLSWTPDPALTLRAGAADHPGRVSFGLSARRASLVCTVSVVGTGVLGRTVRLGMAFGA